MKQFLRKLLLLKLFNLMTKSSGNGTITTTITMINISIQDNLVTNFENVAINDGHVGKHLKSKMYLINSHYSFAYNCALYLSSHL